MYNIQFLLILLVYQCYCKPKGHEPELYETVFGNAGPFLTFNIIGNEKDQINVIKSKKKSQTFCQNNICRL